MLIILSNLVCFNTQNFFFSKHKNEAEYNDMDDSEVLSSDFPGLRTSAASMTSTASTTSMASMTSTASFHQILLILMDGSKDCIVFRY